MPKGFTLIELLIVIAILAILATVIVLVLNPSQLLTESRDSQRVGDLTAVRDAVVFYMTRATTTSPFAATGPFYTVGTSGSLGAGSTRNIYALDGTGWVAVNFNTTGEPAPITALPRDPQNNATYYYGFEGNNTSKLFELVANLESTRFSQGGAEDKESTDGGGDVAIFEVGTTLSF